MAPSDPLHNMPVCFSYKTHAVANCIMTQMMQLIMKLLTSPDHAIAKQENLNLPGNCYGHL